MSWWSWVVATAGTDSPKALSAETEIDAPHFSKWKGGQIPGPAIAARFAKAYGRPVLEAFVEAGFLTADEAGARPTLRPDYSQLTNDELLELVRARMREEGERHGSAAATKPPGSGPAAPRIYPAPVDIAARNDEK